MISIPGLALQNIILIVLSYILLLFINRHTRSNSAFLLLAILTFHHVVAYLYGFHLSTPVNEVDPATFLRKAENCINFDSCGFLGYHLYVNYLAKVLTFGGLSLFRVLVKCLIFCNINLLFHWYCRAFRVAGKQKGISSSLRNVAIRNLLYNIALS